ncbi:hypothetical protein DICVIV_01073 [Dictyocaulus viviparus]|uniref:Uncharacterized protein n=1 Tax=Dictyocaulus viviparus TaxID=29172 RepID=A0A0D8Y9U0_DICVI|nr:hypothetical protein DICVIV_01073 [Dictyocaulus viviparus]
MSICAFNAATENEDSMNTTCCLDYIITVDGFYRASQALHAISGILGVILSICYIWKYSPRHSLPRNTKVFVSMTLAAIIAHSITLTTMHVFVSMTLAAIIAHSITLTTMHVRSNIQYVY